MKITVCQLHTSRNALADDWERLMAHVHSTDSDLVLLPEMPFYPWLASSATYQPDSWQKAVDAHDRFETLFPQAAPAALAATRPVDFGNGRNNVAFIWDDQSGVRSVHSKSTLENREGAWEPVWYVAQRRNLRRLR